MKTFQITGFEKKTDYGSVKLLCWITAVAVIAWFIFKTRTVSVDGKIVVVTKGQEVITLTGCDVWVLEDKTLREVVTRANKELCAKFADYQEQMLTLKAKLKNAEARSKQHIADLRVSHSLLESVLASNKEELSNVVRALEPFNTQIITWDTRMQTEPVRKLSFCDLKSSDSTNQNDLELQKMELAAQLECLRTNYNYALSIYENVKSDTQLNTDSDRIAAHDNILVQQARYNAFVPRYNFVIQALNNGKVNLLPHTPALWIKEAQLRVREVIITQQITGNESRLRQIDDEIYHLGSDDEFSSAESKIKSEITSLWTDWEALKKKTLMDGINVERAREELKTISQLSSPIQYYKCNFQRTTTDTDGRFHFVLPSQGKYWFVATGERQVFDKTEYYFWNAYGLFDSGESCSVTLDNETDKISQYQEDMANKYNLGPNYWMYWQTFLEKESGLNDFSLSGD